MTVVIGDAPSDHSAGLDGMVSAAQKGQSEFYISGIEDKVCLGAGQNF